MDKPTRSAIEKATQRARKLLTEDYALQLGGTFDVLRTGVIAPQAGAHLSPRETFERDKIVAAVRHKQAAGMSAAEAVADYLRDAAFTTLNRFVALKMLEARKLVLECVTKGEESAGYKEFCGMAPGVKLLPDGAGYRLYLESVFDELATEVKVLFDRRDAASVLWPKRDTFDGLLALLNTTELAGVWDEDETIGWVYQYFNTDADREAARYDEKGKPKAPQNSRELAVRNQFFTPRYVVQFLTDNTLGRIWFQMRAGETALVERCAYLVRDAAAGDARPKKDPRDLKVLDPACGSGHFLLYAFDLLLVIYEEAWQDEASGVQSLATGHTLREDYPTLAKLHRALPALIVQHNLHGVDIDPRAAQIAALALWLRAQRAWRELAVPAAERAIVTHSHVVVAEPMPGDAEMTRAFAAGLQPPLLRGLFEKMVGEMRLAGEMGSLLRVEQAIAADLQRARQEFVKARTEIAKPRVTGFLPGLAPVRPQLEIDLSGIDDDRFFHEAESRIVEALRRFSESSAGGVGVQRRLFTGDAGQGIALIDLLRSKFDTVLMNPPFGAGSAVARGVFERAYPRTKNDLYAAFVERAVGLLHKRAMLGAITSRTGFFLSSFQEWRKEVLLKEALPIVFADLGGGVLDSAMVEVAAYCLEVTT